MRLIYSAVLAMAIASGMGGLLTACADLSQGQAPQSTTTESGDMQGMDHGSMDHGSSMNHGMAMDLGPADANYDLRFIYAMSLHHQGSIPMAKEAQQKSQRPEIKELADNIIKAQGKEIKQMQEWRKTWYSQAGNEPVSYSSDSKSEVPMSEQQRQSMGMSQDLGAADAEFDLRFMNGMIPHHEGALPMAQDALKKSKRPEIKQLAQEIITSQQKEIDQMKQWRQAWYKQ